MINRRTITSLQRISRLLNPGGVFMLLEREKSRSPMTLAWGLMHRYLIKDQVEFYQGDQLARLLKTTGFDRVAVKENLNRYLWKGKLYTSITLIEAQKL